MNDDFEVVSDAAREARVVAVVLGEASDFEREEVARLCEESPELKVFRRRMETVHGLLGESVKQKPENKAGEWKLSKERRTEVLAKLGEKETVVELPKKLRLSKVAIWRIAACAAVVILLGLALPTQMKSLPSNHLGEGVADSASSESQKRFSQDELSYGMLESAKEMNEVDSMRGTVMDRRRAAGGIAPDAESSEHLAAPRSSAARVIASNTASPTAIPVPQRKPVDTKIALGDVDYFDAGWELESDSSSGAFRAKEIVSNDFSSAVDDERDSARRRGLDAASQPLVAQVLGFDAAEPPIIEDNNKALARTRSEGVERPNEQGLLESKFTVPETFFKDMVSEAGDDFADAFFEGDEPQEADFSEPRAIKDLLADFGIAFPEGASAEFEPATGELVVRNTADNIALINGITKSLSNSPGFRNAEEQTRSRLLAQVDSAWELGESGSDFDSDFSKNHSDPEEKLELLSELGREEYGFKNGTDGNAGEDLLLRYAAELPIDNNAAHSAYSEYLQSSRELESLRVEGLADGHPKVRELKERRDELRKKNETDESAKKRLKIQAMEEKDAATQGDSTFSLHVSDVSFKLAKAALEQGKWPETVRVEEFVNAFSYGERVLGPHERVGLVMEQAAHPFLSQRNLLRVSLQTAATGRGAGVPLRLTVVLDKSGSMERLDRATAVDEAFRVLVGQLNPGDKVTLVGFSRRPTLLADSVDGGEGARLLQILRETPSEGGTNVEEALKLARAKALEHFEEDAQNRVILLTDGIANLGESVPENLIALIEGMRGEGVAFDACGVGVEGLNDEILEALTRKGDGRYYLLGSTAESGVDFAKQVAGALRPAAQNVKVQIEWNPARVGKWRLYGYEKHELKKEDFRNDSVDAAEIAAEEEGVALYHVEVKSDGEGALGVARVRFLDVATDEMVEREWEIRHEGEAAALKEADEKVRLAGVAGLVAEKLARSAVGERAEWDDLLEMTRQLKTVFPREGRVKDLERMIEQAKGLE